MNNIARWIEKQTTQERKVNYSGGQQDGFLSYVLISRRDCVAMQNVTTNSRIVVNTSSAVFIPCL